jgi:hypothetical protein
MVGGIMFGLAPCPASFQSSPWTPAAQQHPDIVKSVIQYPYQELKSILMHYKSVLRIRDVYPGSDHFLVSRIPDPDPTFFYPGSDLLLSRIRIPDHSNKRREKLN